MKRITGVLLLLGVLMLCSLDTQAQSSSRADLAAVEQAFKSKPSSAFMFRVPTSYTSTLNATLGDASEISMMANSSRNNNATFTVILEEGFGMEDVRNLLMQAGLPGDTRIVGGR